MERNHPSTNTRNRAVTTMKIAHAIAQTETNSQSGHEELLAGKGAEICSLGSQLPSFGQVIRLLNYLRLELRVEKRRSAHNTHLKQNNKVKRFKKTGRAKCKTKEHHRPQELSPPIYRKTRYSYGRIGRARQGDHRTVMGGKGN